MPKTAERILGKIKALSSLKDDTQPLPFDVITAIFRALHLSTEERKKVLPLLERPVGISIAEMRKYTAERFKTYELMARTMNKHWQPQNRNSPPPNNVYVGAGLTDLDPLKLRGKGGQGARGGHSGQGKEQGSGQTHPGQAIRLSIDCLADGAWGTLSGSACICYLSQRYKFKGENRIHIFLYVSATGMNSLTKVMHQVNAELAAIQLAVKETNKCLTTLKDFNIKPGEGGQD